MDNDIINKEKLLICISSTNKVIQRWIHKNNIKSHVIDNDEITSIFKGFFKKHLVKYTPDFKRISKTLRIFTDENKFITDIKMFVIDEYSIKYNATAYNIYSLVLRLTKEDYENCKIIDNDLQFNKEEEIEEQLINFNKIKEINF